MSESIAGVAIPDSQMAGRQPPSSGTPSRRCCITTPGERICSGRCTVSAWGSTPIQNCCMSQRYSMTSGWCRGTGT